MIEYQIVTHEIVVGRFVNEYDRNIAIQKHFWDKGKMAYKKEEHMI